jgi:hypothetical protein
MPKLSYILTMSATTCITPIDPISAIEEIVTELQPRIKKYPAEADMDPTKADLGLTLPTSRMICSVSAIIATDPPGVS